MFLSAAGDDLLALIVLAVARHKLTGSGPAVSALFATTLWPWQRSRCSTSRARRWPLESVLLIAASWPRRFAPATRARAPASSPARAVLHEHGANRWAREFSERNGGRMAVLGRR
jgi:hypothetical protein